MKEMSEPCEHTVSGNWCLVCLKVSGASVSKPACKVRAAGKTDHPQDCDWPWCGCFTHCTCGEEIPSEFPNKGDAQYWVEKHADHLTDAGQEPLIAHEYAPCVDTVDGRCLWGYLPERCDSCHDLTCGQPRSAHVRQGE